MKQGAVITFLLTISTALIYQIGATEPVASEFSDLCDAVCLGVVGGET